MSSAAPNPRRRPAKDAESPMTLIDSFQKMSIRKGDTFHPTTTTAAADGTAFWDPLESRVRSPTSPMRSDTSPQSLEDLLIGSGERRVAQLLNRVDKAVAAKSKVALSNVLSEPEVLPLPTFTVSRAQVPNEPTKTRTRHHSHSSDSGIGTSVSDSVDTASDSDRGSSRTATANSSGRQSLASISDAADEERGLSNYAADQIHKHIVKPILREESLKDFHDLIKSVPTRIGEKEIKTLRDLEKTLIFLAPDYSLSPSKYLHFCERTIRVLHSTVTTLHESDQRAPADRPYTQGYFFDLVEQVRLGNCRPEDAVIDFVITQIRRYATILAATRARQEKDEAADEMDVTKERISLHGGMNKNGKQAELVRHTADGKVISLATERELTEEELMSTSTKRAADLDEDEDEALRSMARRKKNAKPEIHTCELCQKEFKRPCDLTKHVKTHERPWKCPTEDCKYHEYGWPTEKERDRHVNDKHSSTPALYHCLFPPCPYTSKRESNCKQHMEKAHGWNYVRSKSNGKGGSTQIMRLHQGSVPPSPASSLLTPLTPIAPSPSIQSLSGSSRHGSMAPPPTAGPSNYGTPAFTAPSPDFSSHFNMNSMNFDFNDLANFPTNPFPITPAMSEERRGSASLSSHSELQYDGSNFDDGSPQDYNFDNFNWSDFNFPSYTPNSSAAGLSSNGPHISPAGQMDQTFTNDAMHIDENYDDFASGPNQDFTLFGNNVPAATGGEMFPTLSTEASWGNLASNYGGHFDMNSNNTASMPTGNSTLEELFPELKNQQR